MVLTACVQASEDFRYAQNTKKGISERAIRKEQLRMQKINNLIDDLLKIKQDDEKLFESCPHDYFGWISRNIGQIVKLFKNYGYAPTEEHVKAVKLYALMFEAFGNAAKGKDNIDKVLLNNVHSKVPD